jgi:hypothetical protein
MGNKISSPTPAVTHQQIVQRLKKDGKFRQENVKDYSLDPDKVKRWLDSYEPQERKFANYLIKNARHISWTEFRQSLLRVNTEMVHKIKGSRFYLYTPTDTKNSLFYFASLVYENVIFPNPNTRKKCITVNEITLGKIIPASTSEIDILYCDDMSYSGSQLSGNIIQISEYHSPQFYPFLQKRLHNATDIPIYCESKIMERFFLVYGEAKHSNYNPKLTLKNFNLATMKDALLLYQNGGSAKYPHYQWIVLRRESSKNEKLKLHVVESWYSLKEFLEKNRSLQFITLENNPTLKKAIVKYITPVIYTMKPINIYLGIPYFTSSSLDTLAKTKRPGINIIFGGYEKIATINDLYVNLPLSKSGKQRFMYFLLTHFNYYFPTPIQDISDDYIDSDSNPKHISLVWFDHKMADPVSTISVILGCGLVVPYTFRKGNLEIKGKPIMLDSLLKNCQEPSQAIMKKRQEFLQKYYSSTSGTKDAKYSSYTPQDRYACGSCPPPFYK